MFQVKLINNLDDHFLLSWQDLWKKNQFKTFFNSPWWTSACLQAFNEKKIEIYACYRQGVLVGVLPLIVKSKFGFRYKVFPGDRFLDKSAVLFEGEICLNTMLDFASNLPIFLEEVPVEIVQLISRKIIVRTTHCPYLMSSVFSFGDSKTVKRMTQTCKNHSCFFKVFDCQDLEFAMDLVINIENESNKPKLNKAIFGEPKLVNLMKLLIGSAQDNLKVVILFMDEVPVAHYVVMCWQSVFMLYHTAYKEKYKKYSPGNILLFQLINSLQNLGYEKLDFSRGISQQKQKLTTMSDIQHNVIITKSVVVSFLVRFYVLICIVIRFFKDCLKKLFIKIPCK